jgi:mannose-1-phosphate guanylyltransferase / mannose-6-phosphate isomerase
VTCQLEALGMKASILLEPSCRDSGPAIAAGARFISETNPEAIAVVLAADHVVRDAESFQAAVRKATKTAANGTIVTFGIAPDRPATEYGYIRCGAELGDGVFKADAFVEKPDQATARRYIDDGYLWNSGNFLFRVDVLLSEYERLDPLSSAAVGRALELGRSDLGCSVRDRERFNEAAAVSIDVAVMEKTDKIAVIPVDMGWADIGSWQAVWELTDKDDDGNGFIGDAVFLNATNNFVSGEKLVCLVGVDNLAVISTGDATLVFDRSETDAVRPLVKELEEQGRKQIHEHMEVFRPWGSSQSLHMGLSLQVKRIVVKPGGRSSLQKHFQYAKHWIVVHGTALVTIGGSQKILGENESTCIPLGEAHCLENPGEIPLELIEVRSGSYRDDDDIARFSDAYDQA